MHLYEQEYNGEDLKWRDKAEEKAQADSEDKGPGATWAGADACILQLYKLKLIPCAVAHLKRWTFSSQRHFSIRKVS